MDQNFCIRTSGIWQLVGYALFAIKIILPLVIIVLGVVELSKCVVSGKEDEIKKSFTVLLKKLILAIAIFFIPTITNLVFGLVKSANETMIYAEGCLSCVLRPLHDNCTSAVETAKRVRKEYNEELYNMYYDGLNTDRSKPVDYTGENSNGNPEEPPIDNPEEEPEDES